MKKMVILTIAVASLSIGCFDPPPVQARQGQQGSITAANFVGTWEGPDSVLGLRNVFTFHGNGNVQVESLGIINRGTFTVRGNTVQVAITEGFTGILFPDGQTTNYRFRFIDNNRLELTWMGITYSLTRRPQAQAQLQRQPQVAPSRYMFVNLETGRNLRVRETPSLNGRILTTVPSGTMLFTSERSGNTAVIGGTRGHWYRVSVSTH